MISAIALIVSGCGGGGGGSNSSSSVNPEPSTPAFGSNAIERSVANTLVTASRNLNILSRIHLEGLSATGNTPTSSAGGITQTQTDSSSETTVTTEMDSLTLAMGSLATIQSDSTTPTAQVSGVNDYTVYYLSESSTTATPRVAEAVAYTTRTADTTDYATFGYWVVSQDDLYNSTTTEIAAFASGGDALTPTSYLRPATPVTATYRGDAVGFLTSAFSDGTGSIVGTVSLTATLDSTPTVQGMITDITTEVANAELESGLVLGEASLANAAGGFFTGAVSGGTYSGNWGGRFYGDEAEVVSGTIGVATASRLISLIGSFGAEKQPEE